MERTDVITYYGPICPYGVSRLIEITLEAIAHNTSKISLRMDSEGGDLLAAFTAYEHLRSLNVVLETCNINRLKDDAILLYLAGKERFALEFSTWIISEFSYGFGSDSIGLCAAISKNYLSNTNRERFAKIFETRCQNGIRIREYLLSEEKILFSHNRTIMNLSTAIEMGIATRVIPKLVMDSSATNWVIAPATLAK